MHAALKIGMASALAIATASPVAAQYYQPTQQYQQDLQRYQSERNAYEARQSAYQDRREGYEVARADYERRRADWERARADYDARWGYGAYVRRYGAAPVWDTAYWGAYPAQAYVAPAAPYYGAYPAQAYVAPAAPYYGTNSAYTAPSNIRCGNNSTVTAGAIGAGVGRANDRYKCDPNGPYFTRDQTIAYREANGYGYDPNRYRQYNSRGCRLAAAPVDSYGQDYRYVRVCPDGSGRYRITG